MDTVNHQNSDSLRCVWKSQKSLSQATLPLSKLNVGITGLELYLSLVLKKQHFLDLLSLLFARSTEYGGGWVGGGVGLLERYKTVRPPLVWMYGRHSNYIPYKG